MMKIILLFLLSISVIFSQITVTVDPQNVCSNISTATFTQFTLDCSVEILQITTTLAINSEDPSLYVVGNCSVKCSATFMTFKVYSGCDGLINHPSFVALNGNVTQRIAVLKAFDARCTALVDIDPPRIVLLGDVAQSPCTLATKAIIYLGFEYIIGNCSTEIINASNCTDGCYRAIQAVSFLLHGCRDDFRFLDEILFPAVRRGFRVINEICDARRLLATTAEECVVFYLEALNAIKFACSPVITSGKCNPLCQGYLMRSMGIIDRCASLFLSDGNVSRNLPPLDDVVNFLREVRTICNVTSKRVDVSISTNESAVIITSEDALAFDRPRTALGFGINVVFEWILERFERFTDIIAIERVRFRFRFVYEFRPRLNSETDADFQASGLDPNVDNVTTTYDLSDPNVAEYEAITDLGSIDLYGSMGNTTLDVTAFRRVFKCAIRFGPNRLSRVVISVVATNIQNGFGDGEVTIPGGVSYNFQIENVPYIANDTSVAIAFDVDTDTVEGTLVPNATNVEFDPNGGLQLEDPSEDHIEYSGNDTRRVRWKRRVYCDSGKEVVVRSRFVVFTGETPDDGFVVRKRLYVTFHISTSDRCSKVFWDPTNDVSTPPDNYVGPTTGPTSGTGTNNVDTDHSNDVSKLMAALLISIIALLV